MPPERAIARVTGEAARWFRLDVGVIKIGAKADLLLLNPDYLRAPLSEQIELQDPLLDGEMRMVKRGSEKIVEAVYINGKAVVHRGELMPCLGRTKLGEVLRPIDTRGEAATQRNRINDHIAAHPFTDYRDVFLLKHQHPANIALHALGVVLFYGLLALAWALGNAWLLALLPTSQLVGLAGHYFFEPSHVDLQDAVFSVRASRCLNKMFFKLVTGTYGAEVRRANEALRRFQAAQQ